MSYDELAQHAQDIQKKAVEKEGMDQAKVNAQATGGYGAPMPVDYDKIDQKYAFVTKMFEPYTDLPDPASFDPLIEDLRKAMGDLSTGQQASNNELAKDVTFANPKLSKMTTAGSYLEGWNGAAAMSFKENFIDTFPPLANNQFTLLSTLKGALEAHQETWRRARADIDKIAHTTKDALDNAGGCGKNEWGFALSVVSAVVAIASIPVSGPAGAIVISAVGAAASTGSAAKAGIEASGDSAEEITKSMKEAIEKLTEDIKKNEKQIKEALDGITSAVSGNKALFVANRPKLAGMDDGQLTGDSGMGRAN
ncbi:hypothetical protein [Sciscionella sediminilitoris]|uniref:hypothetical protein n=1 Tax=Sciscionella sediminilitoris TaxID=1445613 RepID=UPI0004DED151|nr:hypothetical protein [Sciscionella sp. SE31]